MSRSGPAIEIVGTVDDEGDELFAYTLKVAPLGSDNYKLIETGLSEVHDGVLGTLDPTLFKAGEYTLKLVAEDLSGNVRTVTQNFAVDGAVALGNFALSFTDLDITLGGLPIRVTRHYDTLEADTQHDFGYGWQMGLSGGKVASDAHLSGFEDELSVSTFRYGTRVSVSLPGAGGQRESFTFTPEALDPPEGSGSAGEFAAALLFQSAGLAQPSFSPTVTASPGVTLEFISEHTLVMDMETGGGAHGRRLRLQPRIAVSRSGLSPHVEGRDGLRVRRAHGPAAADRPHRQGRRWP